MFLEKICLLWNNAVGKRIYSSIEVIWQVIDAQKKLWGEISLQDILVKKVHHKSYEGLKGISSHNQCLPHKSSHL